MVLAEKPIIHVVAHGSKHVKNQTFTAPWYTVYLTSGIWMALCRSSSKDTLPPLQPTRAALRRCGGGLKLRRRGIAVQGGYGGEVCAPDAAQARRGEPDRNRWLRPC